MCLAMSDNPDRLDMQIQSSVIDHLQLIEDNDGEIGYISNTGELFVNASTMIEVAGMIKNQAMINDNEDAKFAFLASALAVIEGVKLTHQHIVSIDVDTMFNER